MSEEGGHTDAGSEDLKILPSKYELSVTTPEQTGIRTFNLADKETEVTATFVEFNPSYDVHTAAAWAGARTSRSDKSHIEIYSQIKGVNRAQKIDMFYDYGHASIANMSPLMLHINNLPMKDAYQIFNSLVLVGGQESSTRYIELSNPTVTPLEKLIDLSSIEQVERSSLIEEWGAIQQQAHAGFAKWYPIIEEDLFQFVKHDPKAKPGSMSKRALDAARAWLPFGGKTSMSLQIDTRETINLVGQLYQRQDFYGQGLAEQLETLVCLKDYSEGSDIQADLTWSSKYSKGYDNIQTNTYNLAGALADIPEFEELQALSVSRIEQEPQAHESEVNYMRFEETEGSIPALISGYISTLLPNLRFKEVTDFTKNLDANTQETLAKIIIEGHNRHRVLRNAADFRGDIVEFRTALAYQRDFNRHRAMGRLATMLESRSYEAIVKRGFNRSHVLANTKVLRLYEDEWNQDFTDLYQRIYSFYDRLVTTLGSNTDYSFIYHLLPLGHQSDLVMSAPFMQWNYFSDLRIRPGGDYGYRELTYSVVEQIRARTLGAFAGHLVAPDYNSPSELLDRT